MGALLLSGPPRVPAAEPATPQARAGAQLFVRYCIQCHGTDGRGEPGRVTLPVIPDFTDPAFHQSHTNPQMVISILEGKDRLMPAHGGTLSPEQAAQLVAYVRTFDPSRPAPADPAPSPKGEPSRPASPGPYRSLPLLTGTGDFEAQFNRLAKEYDRLDQQIRELASAPAPRSVAQVKVAPPKKVAPQENVVPQSVATGPARFFGQNCSRCHTIGGGTLIGPDLKNVCSRKDRDWLVQFLLSPEAMIHSGDPYAAQLQARSRGVVMPTRFGAGRERPEAVLDFIEAESRKKKSLFGAPPISDRRLTAADAARGRELFVGDRRLANGGPACIACHAVQDNGAAEGGRLGPDLTKAYERLGGRTALAAHLWGSPTPTMLPLYQKHPLDAEEVLSLVAYLKETDRAGVEDASPIPVNFLLMGLGGTVLGLAAVNSFWRGRGRARSQPALNGRAAPALRSENELLALSQGRATEGAAAPAAPPGRTEFPEDYPVPGL